METGIKLDAKMVEVIIHRILSLTSPEKIILFGSSASGEISPDSDIDLLVVEKAPGDQRKESIRLRKKLCELGYPFDVIVI